MNELLYKNTFIRDKNTIGEMFKNYYLKSTRFKIIYYILIAAQLFSFCSDLDFFFTILFYNCIAIALILLSYYYNVKIAIKRDKEISNGKEILVDVNVYDDRLEANIIEYKHTLYWGDVDYASATKNYIIINTKARFSYILKKDSFSIGTSEQFLEFLKDNNIKVK